MKAQEYLDKYYPKEERQSISTLNLNDKGLEGELDLSDFVNLKELDLSASLGYPLRKNKITKLNLSNNKKLEELDCVGNELTDLDLSNNSELRSVGLGGNKLTSLDLSNKKQLEVLGCQSNKLTHLDLKNSNKLKVVLVFTNAINANLNIFSHLTEVVRLDLGDASVSPYHSSNDFHGSLKSLENCKKLKDLCIGQNRKIIEGLEYLPTENLNHFGCHGTVFKDALKPFDYDVKAWKIVNHPNLFADLDIRQTTIERIEQTKQIIDDIKNKKCNLNCNPEKELMLYNYSGHHQECLASSYDKSNVVNRLKSKINLLEQANILAKSQNNQQTQTDLTGEEIEKALEIQRQVQLLAKK